MMVGNTLRTLLSHGSRTRTAFFSVNLRHGRASPWLCLAGAAVLLAGCGNEQSLEPLRHQKEAVGPMGEATPLTQPGTAAPSLANPLPASRRAPATLYPGTGVFVSTVAPLPGAPQTGATKGDITLNFVDADVRQVLPRVLGDVLHLNYTIDPKVHATVTLQTSRPLQREDVLPALQEALRASGLALVETKNVYRLLPVEEAVGSGALPVGSGPNLSATYNVQILPLKYVPANEVEKTLRPFLPKGAAMEVDTSRNLLIISGLGVDLSTIVNMVKDFDVNWISGMSFAIVPLQSAAPQEITDALTKMFGPKGSMPLPGLLSFAPLVRMDAVLVVSPQRAYVEEANNWIERLDHGEGQNQPRIYEYHVQNGRAVDIAKVLTRLFANGQVSVVEPQTAPETKETTIGAVGLAGGSGLGSSAGGLPGAPSATALSSPSSTLLSSASGMGTSRASSSTREAGGNEAAGSESDLGETGAAGGSSGTESALPAPPVRIVADAQNNTLVIYATPQVYRMIDESLQRIDVPPVQVLIEATVAEVDLNNELQYGLQYFFHAHENQFIFGAGSNPILAAPIAGTFPGFNYILGSANANVVLNLLSSITNVHVVSSPEILVLNNEPASLLVGSEIPIPTAQIQSTITSGAPIVNTIQYVDTGVILKVTPRVNANGVITLNVRQEVSSVAGNTSATSSLGPTITERRIDSSISVQDGQTVALGGLIQDNNNLSRNGLPVLSDIPVVGPLFRSTTRTNDRTELLVLLSPVVLHDAADATAATNELRNRLRALQQGLPQTP